MDVSCFPFGVDCYPIGLVCSDVSDSADSPEVGVLVSPVVDTSLDVPPAVGHTVLPLPSVENIFVQDMLWAPVELDDSAFFSNTKLCHRNLVL